MRVLVTRPAADAAPLAAMLAARGHRVTIDPVIDIIATSDPAPKVAPGTILVFTSANGVRVWADKSGDRGLAAYAVGRHTAAAAIDAGFAGVTSADGDVEALVALLRRRHAPEDARFLHVAGEDTAGDLAGQLTSAGFEVETHVAYRAVQRPRLAESTRDALAAGHLDGILFYSPRTARHFTHLLRAAGLAETTGRLTAFCLSPAVADGTRSLSFDRIDVARTPTQDALLELLS